MTMARLLESGLPIVGAPMAGGPGSVTLGAAVAASGGFPFLAAGYKTPQALAEEIATARGWAQPFGVNLFVTGADPPDRTAFAAYARRLRPEAAVYGLVLDETPRTDDDYWPEKLSLLIASPVPVVSFTFGLPETDDITRLRRSGTAVLASVTTVAEARAAEAGGVDGLIVQGPRAGGHSATWNPLRPIRDRSTGELVREVRAATRLPLLAAGGVDSSASARDLLAAGAEAVAVGTLLLRAEEAGTSTTHRNALAARPAVDTIITRAFTGRPARALRNGFIDRHHAAAPVDYPAVHHLTSELRRRAAAAGDSERLHLWAGTGYRYAAAEPAGRIVVALAQDL